MKENLTWYTKLKRGIHFRLIVPLKRSTQDPVILARGVLVGMAWAMTPLVGIQMTTVLVTWVIAKKLFSWSFSLPIALAFTWVTNVFTMVPIYYVFYVTGKIMMGDFSNITGWDSVKEMTQNTFFGDYSTYESILLFCRMLLQDWGLAMAVGCLPWAFVMGWISYRWSLKFLISWRARHGQSHEKRRYWRSLLKKANGQHAKK